MPYVLSNGSVVQERSSWRISIVSDAFWAVVNFVGLFFDTLINPQRKIKRNDKLYDERARKTVSGELRGAKGSNIKNMPKADDCST